MNDEVVEIDTDDGRRNPRKTFYMCLAVINEDNTVNPEEQVSGTHDTLAEAVEMARANVEAEDDGEYIYECRPVRRVSRGPVRVQALMKPSPK